MYTGVLLYRSTLHCRLCIKKKKEKKCEVDLQCLYRPVWVPFRQVILVCELSALYITHGLYTPTFPQFSFATHIRNEYTKKGEAFEEGFFSENINIRFIRFP